MEEKKFDPWQFVGFFLIALILTWMLYNQPPVEEVQIEIAQTESTVDGNKAVVLDQTPNEEQLNAAYGSFANLFQATTSSDNNRIKYVSKKKLKNFRRKRKKL